MTVRFPAPETEFEMKKGIAALAIGAALALTPVAAMAASPADQCEAAGGTYANEGGTKSCAFPVGNSDNVKTTGQKGSFNSSHPESKTNPGGNQPPGQQGGNDLGK